MSAALLLLGPLDGLDEYACAGLRRAPCSQATLRRLATESDEKCGLPRVWDYLIVTGQYNAVYTLNCLMSNETVDVVAFAAHPDDAELGCAGAILNLVGQGRRVGIVDMTSGELASRGTPEQRNEEARRAGDLLGVAFRTSLGLEDGEIEVSSENRLAVIEIIRQYRPSTVLTHARGIHPDHMKTRMLVSEAVHHSGLAKIATAHERFRPDKLMYWIDFNENMTPDVVVDISEVYDAKEEAIRAHASQLYSPSSREPETYLSRTDFLEQVRAFHRHLGNLVGARYGEGFVLSRPVRVADATAC